jgi:site-specific recombinase XerD
MAIAQLKQSATPKPIDRDFQDFWIDRQARNLTRQTLNWYAHSLNKWRAFLNEDQIERTEDVTPASLRRFLVWLADRGHNAGGVVHVYGAAKAYLHWYATEYAPAGWQNPLERVKPPKRPDAVLEPLALTHFEDMLQTCKRKTRLGDRDRALLLTLLDSGLRHAELTDLRVGDVDLQTGAILVRMGKGRKWRTVFVGASTRRALVTYLHRREEINPASALWLTRAGTPLTRAGIYQIVIRRAKMAGVPVPGMHDFRRAFAINFLRNGGDVATLQRLLGHTDLRVINRYLKLLDDDLHRAHEQYSPVEGMKRRARK